MTHVEVHDILNIKILKQMLISAAKRKMNIERLIESL